MRRTQNRANLRKNNNFNGRKNGSVKMSYGRRRRTSRRGRSRGGSHYVETFPVSIEVGKEKKLTVALLTNRPKNFPFRIQYVHFVGLTSFDPLDDKESGKGIPGFFGPSALQLTLLAPTASTTMVDVASSGPVMLGLNPRNIKVHQPRTQDWWEEDTAPATAFAKLTSVCFGKAITGQARYIRGLIHVFIKFGTLIAPSGCPAVGKLVTTDDDPVAINDASDTNSSIDEFASSSPGVTGEFENLTFD